MNNIKEILVVILKEGYKYFVVATLSFTSIKLYEIYKNGSCNKITNQKGMNRFWEE